MGVRLYQRLRACHWWFIEALESVYETSLKAGINQKKSILNVLHKHMGLGACLLHTCIRVWVLVAMSQVCPRLVEQSDVVNYPHVLDMVLCKLPQSKTLEYIYTLRIRTCDVIELRRTTAEA
jgi:hypothetical protein